MVSRFVSEPIELPAREGEGEQPSRADLVFYDVDHSGDSYEEPISYEMLIRVGHEGLAEGEIIGGYSLCDALDAAGRDFWRNWSIVTGVPAAGEEPEGGTAPSENVRSPRR